MRLFLLIIFIAIWSFDIFPRRVNTGSNISSSIPSEWKDLLNPKTEKFWQEGNHRPDAGMVLLAQKPDSIQYAKLWLLRMELKAKTLEIMQKTIDKAQKELYRDGLIEDRYLQFVDEKKAELVKIDKEKLQELNMYFLFDSTCPHCNNLSEKLSRFSNVQPLQVDRKRKLKEFKNLENSAYAEEETIKNYLVNGVVPVVLIENKKISKIVKIVGNRSINDYLSASLKLIKEE